MSRQPGQPETQGCLIQSPCFISCPLSLPGQFQKRRTSSSHYAGGSDLLEKSGSPPCNHTRTRVGSPTRQAPPSTSRPRPQPGGLSGGHARPAGAAQAPPPERKAPAPPGGPSHAPGCAAPASRLQKLRPPHRLLPGARFQPLWPGPLDMELRAASPELPARSDLLVRLAPNVGRGRWKLAG